MVSDPCGRQRCDIEPSVPQDTYRRRQMQRTLTRQMSFDLTKLLVTEDWFSDISPQTMRRLLNIVSVTGNAPLLRPLLLLRPPPPRGRGL